MDLLDTFDKYITLPREQAYNQYLDEKNLKIFRIVLLIMLPAFLILFIVNIADNESFNFSLVLTIVNIIIILAARIFYKKLFDITNIRRSIFIFLVFQMVMTITIEITYPADVDEKTEQSQEDASGKKQAEKKQQKDTVIQGDDFSVTVDTDERESYLELLFFMGILVLIFKFSRTEIVQLFAIATAIPLLAMIVLNVPFTSSNTISNIVVGLVLFIVAYSRDKSRQRKFYEQYDFHYRKNYESMRMKKELDYAREIQLSMLPENDAVIGEIEISGVSIPASEVGGDYFDYFRISENEVGFFICDVSGHGVASGLMLSGLRSCMHLILEDDSHPKEIMEKLNRMIRKTQSRKMFVTAVLAIINTEKNKCTLFNAGHLPPYRISSESKEIFKIKKHGIALGAMQNVDRTGGDNEVVFDFRKGDKLILYTDGISEAMNSSMKEYGLDSLEFYLNSNSDKNARELLKGLIADVKKFTVNGLQRDDLTLLIIQRN